MRLALANRIMALLGLACVGALLAVVLGFALPGWDNAAEPFRNIDAFAAPRTVADLRQLFVRARSAVVLAHGVSNERERTHAILELIDSGYRAAFDTLAADTVTRHRRSAGRPSPADVSNAIRILGGLPSAVTAARRSALVGDVQRIASQLLAAYVICGCAVWSGSRFGLHLALRARRTPPDVAPSSRRAAPAEGTTGDRSDHDWIVAAFERVVAEGALAFNNSDVSGRTVGFVQGPLVLVRANRLLELVCGRMSHAPPELVALLTATGNDNEIRPGLRLLAANLASAGFLHSHGEPGVLLWKAQLGNDTRKHFLALDPARLPPALVQDVEPWPHPISLVSPTYRADPKARSTDAEAKPANETPRPRDSRSRWVAVQKRGAP